MKKLFTVISILLLVFWSFSALGEGIDLSSMSEQELIELDIAIREEIANRNPYSDVILYPGVYYVEDDFPVGGYLFHALEDNEEIVRVVNAKTDDDETIAAINVGPGENGHLSLCEGTWLGVFGGSVIIIQQ